MYQLILIIATIISNVVAYRTLERFPTFWFLYVFFIYGPTFIMLLTMTDKCEGIDDGVKEDGPIIAGIMFISTALMLTIKYW